jgi:hypothetical protein
MAQADELIYTINHYCGCYYAAISAIGQITLGRARA